MKKILISVMALAVAAMGFVSCQKDQTSGLQFTATMSEQVSGDNGKTAYDAANGLHWEAGDTIVVMSAGGYWGVFTADPESGNPRNAVFNECNTLWGEEYNTMTLRDDNAPYFAVYPADENTVSFLWDAVYNIMASGSDINYFAYFPMEYNTVGGELTHFPMMAYSSTTNLQFKNAGGAIRLNLTKAGVNVSRIVVESYLGDNQLAGAFDSGFSVDGEPEVTVFSNPNWRINSPYMSDSVAVNCSGAPSIAEGHDFFIPLPAGTYRNLTFTIYTNDGRVCTKTMNANATLNIVRSQYSTITLGEGSLEFVDPNIINGLFTVNAEGKQVYFSRGNLFYSYGEWYFFPQQYDYVGAYNTTTWDLFGWSNGSSNNFGMSTSTSNNDYSGSFVDWGTQIGDGHTWYTLSNDEWGYVFDRANGDKMGFGSVLDSYGRYNGIILLPDEWTLPAGLTFSSGWSNGWNTNQYTEAQWQQMEAAGAVFLPAAGYRLGDVVSDTRVYAYYWSSTPVAYYWYYSGYDNHRGSGRRYGQSVRLVKDYQGN